MILTRTDACKVLGIPANASQEQWKKAYREICMKYHPDVVEHDNTIGYDLSKEQAKQYFMLATDAYHFLEKESSYVSIPCGDQKSDTYGKTKTKGSGKIIGNRSSFVSNHEEYKKNQKDYRKKQEQEKKRKLEEINARGKKLREEEQKSKEQKLLDQIRWLRVAQIIHQTIEEDKNKNL